MEASTVNNDSPELRLVDIDAHLYASASGVRDRVAHGLPHHQERLLFGGLGNGRLLARHRESRLHPVRHLRVQQVAQRGRKSPAGLLGLRSGELR